MAKAAIAMATMVSCNKEGAGDGGKSDGDEDGGQATATVTTWAMVRATRLAGDKEGKCKGGKGNGDSNEGGRRWRQPLKQCPQWQRRRQRLWRWQTTTETAGAGNNQQNAVGNSGSGCSTQPYACVDQEGQSRTRLNVLHADAVLRHRPSDDQLV
jgi:hypothetical protein